MKQSFTSLCSEFANKARYNLSLIPQIPNDKIMAVMDKDGWKKASVTVTPQQMAAAASAVGHGAVWLPNTTVKNAEGKDAIMGGDHELYQEYRQAVRKAAAQVYGINPK